MNKTESELKQTEPVLVYKINTGITNLPLDVEVDLQKYPQIFITRVFDVFRIVHCCEAASRDYIIYGETKEGDKKVLFTSNYHFECCNCCEQCIFGCFCCGYACCDSILFQMDYKRNGNTFYTQGYNIKKGCHCGDICIINPLCACIPCVGNKLYLRENIDPDAPDYEIGKKKGKTQTKTRGT